MNSRFHNRTFAACRAARRRRRMRRSVRCLMRMPTIAALAAPIAKASKIIITMSSPPRGHHITFDISSAIAIAIAIAARNRGTFPHSPAKMSL